MAGIAGLIDADPHNIACWKVRTRDLLGHRGAGEPAFAHRGSLVLAQVGAMPSWEASAHPGPLVVHDGHLTVVADARIDNGDELAESLGLSSTHTTLSAGILIARAYERWGRDCPRYLLGDFAFAVWDSKHEVLTLARDPMGVRPLFYAEGPVGRFAFASESLAMAAVPALGEAVDELSVVELVADLRDDESRTLLRSVRRLPPAHVLVYSEDTLRMREYWKLHPDNELRLASDTDYEEAFRAELERSVRGRMAGGGPWAVTLSGGLDSSTVAVVARDVQIALGAPELLLISGGSARFPTCDERGYSKAVGERAGLPVHRVEVSGDRPLVVPIAAAVRALDEPRLVGLDATIRAVCEEAHSLGAQALLTGMEGDSVMAEFANGHLEELVATRECFRLWREARGLARVRGGSAIRLIAGAMSRAQAPAFARRLRERRSASVDERNRVSFLRPSARVADHMAERIADEWNGYWAAGRTHRAFHRWVLTHPGRSWDAQLADRCAVRLGIEASHPLSDRRFVEFCLSLPTGQKVRDGITRSIARRSMLGRLPEAVRNRMEKAAFDPLVAARMRLAYRRSQDEVWQSLRHLDGLIDHAALRSVVEADSQRAPVVVSAHWPWWRAIVAATWIDEFRRAACTTRQQRSSLDCAQRAQMEAMAMAQENTVLQSAPVAETAKKKYAPPALTRYGSVVEMTAGNPRGSILDGGAGRTS